MKAGSPELSRRRGSYEGPRGSRETGGSQAGPGQCDPTTKSAVTRSFTLEDEKSTVELDRNTEVVDLDSDLVSFTNNLPF